MATKPISFLWSVRSLPRRALLSAPLALALPAGLTRPARQSAVAPVLLVRGETLLATDQGPLAWRVVHGVAETTPAAFESRALGFAVARAPFGQLLLTDECTGSAYRLVGGEAAFVRDGTVQRRESLGTTAKSYLRIELVAAQAVADAGGDRPVFTGAAFAVPAGTITVSLHRVELAEGDTISVLPSTGEQLVLVEQGDVELEGGEAADRELLRTTVGSDTVYAVRSVAGAAILYGARGATSVLVASLA